MKIAIFYHVYQLDNHPNIPKIYWERMYDEQMRSLAVSGVLTECEFVHVGINGTIIPSWLPKVRVKLNSPSEKGETATLKSIRDFCLNKNNEEYKILYFHQKGLKDINNEASKAWRLMMEYFVIHKWKECVSYLNDYDCVGVNWLEHTYVGRHPHFSGNFWWANAKHIANLNHSYLEDQENTVGSLMNVLNKEFWIGSKPNTKAKSIHDSGLGEGGHYNNVYHQKNYIQI